MDFKQTLIDSFRVLKIISEKYKIDLKDIDFITPFIITPISAYIYEKDFKKPKKSYSISIIKPKNPDILSYLDFIKFPFGISVKKFKNLNNLKTYFPLFCFSNEDIKSGEILKKFEICLDFFAHSLKSKELVYQPLDELIDNILEHAFSSNCFIHAQIYSKKYLALSIVDVGETIPESYRKAGFNIENDSKAFELILSGISSTKDPTRGYGLNSNINIISSALKGSITIVSGKSVLSKTGEEEPIIYNLENYGLNFKGTFVNILFEIPNKRLDISSYDFIGKKNNLNKVYKHKIS